MGICEGLSRMSWKLSRTVLRGGVTGNGGSLLGRKSEGDKQPYFIRPKDAGYFAFAGIWDHWQGEGGEVIESCAIITTEAVSVLRDIHDRMPVILGEGDVGAWLDTATGKKEVLRLLQPFPEETLEAYPVAALVNSPRNNRPECVARVNV
jgi:putative SOS response-associated peptidase YedK